MLKFQSTCLQLFFFDDGSCLCVSVGGVFEDCNNHNFHCHRFISLFSPSLCFSDRYVLVGSHHDDNNGGGALAIMNQLIAALTEQTKRGWVPNRTTVFCSWGGTALGNIGSYEWGKVSKKESMCFI